VATTAFSFASGTVAERIASGVSRSSLWQVPTLCPLPASEDSLPAAPTAEKLNMASASRALDEMGKND
jgi:hypothetical protein